jgi:hypothetical protein
MGPCLFTLFYIIIYSLIVLLVRNHGDILITFLLFLTRVMFISFVYGRVMLSSIIFMFSLRSVFILMLHRCYIIYKELLLSFMTS